MSRIDFANYFYNHLPEWLINEIEGKCTIKIFPKDDELLRKNFDISSDEQLLFYRDNSIWGKRNQGIVMTDNALYYLPNVDNPNYIKMLKWTEILSVRHINNVFYIDNVTHDFPPIPEQFFFVGEIDNQETINNKLAYFLSELVNYA